MKKYTKQILSDALADLGESLGRVPRPSDLKSGMASRTTYLRWFGTWDTALEYAGYTKDETTDVVETPETSTVVSTARRVTSPYSPDRIKLINLYGPGVVLKGNMEDELPCEGIARAIFAPTLHASAEKLLSHLISGAPVLVVDHAVDLLVLRSDGKVEPFPAYSAGTFYLVSKKAALAAREIGRSIFDLIYPGLIESPKNDPRKVISKLEMLYHPKLWCIKQP